METTSQTMTATTQVAPSVPAPTNPPVIDVPTASVPEPATIQTIYNTLIEQQKKIDSMFITVEKMRVASVRSMWLTIIFVVLPIILSVFAIPFLAQSYLGSLTEGGTASPIDMKALMEQVKNAQKPQE